MSEAIKKIYETVTNALDINQSILSGCIDIVVAEQPNGQLKSSPFHLRFGKFQALRGRDAIIEIYINDQKTDVQMKLGRAGEGYFDLSTYSQSKLLVVHDSESFLTDDGLSEIDNASMSEDDSSHYQQVDKQSMEQVQEFLEGPAKKKERTWNWIWGNFPQKNEHSYRNKKNVESQQPKLVPIAETKVVNAEEGSVFKSFMGILKGKKETIKEQEQHKPKQSEADQELLSNTLAVMAEQITRSPIKEGPRSPPSEKDLANTQFQDLKDEAEEEGKQVIEQETIKIENKESNDIVEISLCAHLIKESQSEELKFQLFDHHKVSSETFLKDPAKIAKEQNLMFKIGDFLYQREVGFAIILSKTVYGKDLRQEQFVQDKKTGKKSLWGRWFGYSKAEVRDKPSDAKDRNEKTESKSEKTDKKEQTEKTNELKNRADKFEQNEKLVNKNDKPEKIGNHQSGEKQILISIEQPKDDDVIEEKQQKEKRADKSQTTRNPLSGIRKASDDQQFSDTSSIQSYQAKRVKRSLKPSSDILKRLGLRYGVNTITYKVHTELQGLRELKGNIFLFKSDTQVVISDVDGTITKSDVFGQLMPMMGTDWTHAGVAKLYQAIAKQGYEIIYLTARGIGQSNQTKGFIYSMQQGEIQLPLGPVIMSPDRLLPSFKREVIDKKPEVFKIQALKDIKNIFYNENPMYAGFGNRETDALAYETVGIDRNKIFIIDTESQIHMIDRDTVTSYEQLYNDVDEIFPSIVINNIQPEIEEQEQKLEKNPLTNEISNQSPEEQDIANGNTTTVQLES